MSRYRETRRQAANITLGRRHPYMTEYGPGAAAVFGIVMLMSWLWTQVDHGLIASVSALAGGLCLAVWVGWVVTGGMSLARRAAGGSRAWHLLLGAAFLLGLAAHWFWNHP